MIIPSPLHILFRFSDKLANVFYIPDFLTLVGWVNNGIHVEAFEHWLVSLIISKLGRFVWLVLQYFWWCCNVQCSSMCRNTDCFSLPLLPTPKLHTDLGSYFQKLNPTATFRKVFSILHRVPWMCNSQMNIPGRYNWHQISDVTK